MSLSELGPALSDAGVLAEAGLPADALVAPLSDGKSLQGLHSLLSHYDTNDNVSTRVPCL